MRKIPAIITAVNRSPYLLAQRSLLSINGKTILQMIHENMKQCRYVTDIVLSTSIETVDDSLVKLAKELGMLVSRGEYDDVLGRLLKTYEFINTDQAFILRGDTPFIDPFFCDKLFEMHSEQSLEFSYSEHLFGLPYGLGSEIISLSALEKLKSLKIKNLANKISIFINMNESLFRASKLMFDNPNPDVRFVIENLDDYEFIKELSSLIDGSTCSYDLLETLNRHPYLEKINKPLAQTEEIGLDKLILFPEKIKEITNQNFDNHYPISVELSLTNNCNLNCQWCSDAKLRAKSPDSLNFETISSLIMDLAENRTKGIVIEGGGEPTIHLDFQKTIRLARNNNLAVGLITNGVKCDYHELLPDFEWIRISLDADSPETYKVWKGGDHFYRVLENIKTMCEIKGDCVIGVGYVVTKHNIKYLEELTILLANYGVDYLYLRPVIDHEDMRVKENLLYLKKYESPSFTVMIQAMEENLISGNQGLPCLSNSLSTVVAADGSVYLCGRLNIHDWMRPIGNINSSSFSEIWNGDERKRQMKIVKNGDFCQKWCPECRMTKYNILFNKTNKIKTRNFI